MSLVMAYVLFWMMFIHKQECAVIRYHHNRNTFEYVIQKYMNPLRRLSADLPNHAIEMEIEIHGSVPRTAANDPRRFIRLINPGHIKPIPRMQDEAGDKEVPLVPDAEKNTAVTPDAGQVTAAPAPVNPPAVPAPVTPPGAPTPPADNALLKPPDPDTQKIPVYMADLKKALDELEKKLMITSENSPAVKTTPSTGVAGGLLNPNAPVRSIDDIVQLLKRAIHVEHRMPKIGDENVEWVQIKIPKSVQL